MDKFFPNLHSVVAIQTLGASREQKVSQNRTVNRTLLTPRQERPHNGHVTQVIDDRRRSATSRYVDERVHALLRERQSTLGRQVSPSVVESWARSVRYGLDPNSVEPSNKPDYDMDSRLLSIADAVMSTRSSSLDLTEGCLFLTNNSGVILRQWSGDSALSAELHRLDVEPGFLVSETTLGTTSGSTLITGVPSFVRGPEHFGDQFVEYTSAGMVISHPVLRRMIGSINLICRFRDTSPAALGWVCEIVRAIEAELLDGSTQSEQLLMQGFLLENRDSRHPVVAVNERTVVTNTAAARMLGTVDQLMLWEYASRIASNPDQAPPPFTLGDGSTATVRCRSITNDDALVGIVMNLARSHPARTRPVPAPSPLHGLIGSTLAWKSMSDRISRCGGASLLLHGEQGVGKFAIAQTVAGPHATVLDAAECRRDPAHWIARVEHALNTSEAPVIIRHLEQIPPDETGELAGALAQHQHATRIIGTSTEPPPERYADAAALSQFVATVAVPPLRDRMGDLPDLVAHFTARALAQSGRDSVRWMSDALQALSRVTWADNLTGLERTVRQVVASTRFGYIGSRDLPVNLAIQAARRQLSTIERAEASAIIDALHNADGNKLRAAEALGIARSTLYRKLRSLGIDLEESNF